MADEINPKLAGINFTSPNRYNKRQGAKPNAINFIPKEFDNALEDQGTRVRITPSILCPNQTAVEDTNHALDCPFCFGQRTIDLCDKAIESWASFDSITLDKNFNVPGIFDLKDAKMTFQTFVRVYYWYKIEVLDFASIYNQMIKKSSLDTDLLRYDPTPNCDTPYHLIDSQGKRYYLNEHYKADMGNRRIIWLTANRPAAGSVFSISYPILPTFRIIELLHDNRYYYVGFKQKQKAPIQLPQQAAVRWDYLAKNSGSNMEPVP